MARESLLAPVACSPVVCSPGASSPTIVWTEAAGYRLPAHWGDPAAEYQAALCGAVLFDRSHTAKLEVSGPDAPIFLTNLSTNDLRELPLGGGCETYFLDHRAKTLFQTLAYHVRLAGARHAIWLESTPGYAERLLKHLDRYLIAEAVELADLTAEYAQFHLTGPQATAVLEQALQARVPTLAEFEHMERTLGGTACSVRRRSPLGWPGYDIVGPAAAAVAVWQALITAGATPAGQQTYDVLRVEAGTPEYGPDIDETRFVMEIAQAERAISYSKGCFIGQEPIVMARDRAGHVNRAFLAVKAREATAPIPPGTKLLLEGQDVGVVTSSVLSPRAGGVIANAYIRRPHWTPGLTFTAMVDGQPVTAELLGWPAVPPPAAPASPAAAPPASPAAP